MSSQDPQSLHWHFSTEIKDNDFQIHGRALFFIIILFALVTLISLFFFYARWVCRYQQHHFPSNPPSHAPHALPLSQLQGLHPSIIKAMPITLHKTSSSCVGKGSTECCICLGVFEEGDKVKVLPECNHCFHSECVDKWLTSQSTCPLCRACLRCNSTVISISTE